MWLNRPSAVRAFHLAHTQRELLERYHFDPRLVRGIQRSKLELVWDRVADVPRYRDEPGVLARDLSMVPVMEQDELTAEPEAFLRPGLTGPIAYHESSGTTSVPTPTPRAAEDTIANAIAVSSLWHTVLTAEPQRVASLLPSDVTPVGNFVAAVNEYLGHTFLRCYPGVAGICDFDRLARLFGGYRPTVLFGVPGVLARWSRILESHGTLAEVSSSVRAILLLGEVSLPGQRATLSEDWSAAVFDASYGSTETGTIAATCRVGGLHLLEMGHMLEVRRAGELLPARPGASGELVTTTLNNVARPLLRYATGDLVDVLTGRCECGIPLPLVRVHGRGADRVALNGSAGRAGWRTAHRSAVTSGGSARR